MVGDVVEGLLGSSIARPRVMIFEERPVQVIHSVWDHEVPISYDMHYGLELGVVLAGRVTRHFKSGPITYGPGEIWFHNLWESHGWSVPGVPAEALVLIIHPQALEQLRFPEVPEFSFVYPFAAEPALRPRVPEARRPETLSISATILRHAASDAGLRALQLRVLLMQLVLTACEDWTPPGASSAAARPVKANLEPALRLVAERRRFLAVTEAAHACGMSAKAFRRDFRTLMGVSFPKFALRYRVDGVAAQLLQGSDSVKAIAVDWGFTDTSHLGRSFRRFYGCFPMEYRERYSR